MPLFTLGHSTTPKEKLIELFKCGKINVLLDCRSHPKARIVYYWRDGAKGLTKWVPELGIEYRHFWKLGGFEARHLEYQSQIPLVDVSMYTGKSFPREKLSAVLRDKMLITTDVVTKTGVYNGLYYGMTKEHVKDLKKSKTYILVGNHKIDKDEVISISSSADIETAVAEINKRPETEHIIMKKGGHDIQYFMTLQPFFEGIKEAVELAKDKNVAMMCTEPEWWRCHRGMISDFLWYKKIDTTHLRQSTMKEPVKIWKHSEVIGERLNRYYPEVKEAWDKVQINE
jgi:hypothetical protein